MITYLCKGHEASKESTYGTTAIFSLICSTSPESKGCIAGCTNRNGNPNNPILRGENPWESVASLYGTVLYDPENSLFKMWYLTGPYADSMVQVRQRNALGNITLLGYATSTDGVQWEKPILNQVRF